MRINRHNSDIYCAVKMENYEDKVAKNMQKKKITKETKTADNCTANNET
jgi:hypothetical protein